MTFFHLLVYLTYQNEYALLLKLAAIVLFGSLIFSEFSQRFASFSFFYEQELFSQTYSKTVLKILGIVLVTQLSSDICRDNGETAISTMAELAGKLSILVISLPMIE